MLKGTATSLNNHGEETDQKTGVWSGNANR